LKRLRASAGRRALGLLLALGAVQSCLFESNLWAQQCPAADPARAQLEQIIDCLRKPVCERQIPEEKLEDELCVSSIYKWDEDPEKRFVAIRDIKMCQSRRRAHDPQFVHGLLMPLQHVCGVEDNKLYDDSLTYLRSMWKRAWEVALSKLPEEEIALVVNPPTIRSQDQLHIHIVRRNRVSLPTDWVKPLDGLDDVWRQARSFARTKGISDSNYGILVCKSHGRFEMLVEPGKPLNQQNPERKYTRYED